MNARMEEQLEQQMEMSFSPSSSSNTSFNIDSPKTLSSSSSSSSVYDASNSKQSCPPSIGVNLRVTGQCSQGGRKYMEDYFSVAYQQSENTKDLEYAFIGIYDGHGGAEAAIFAKEHLMMEIINQKLFWSDSDHDVLRAIREGYIATHYAMWRAQGKWPKTANGLPSTAGTTATVAFIRREKIYIGHVGDSGIVLGYQNENENFWRSKQLTMDHKPESGRERDRIRRSGGKVVIKSGVPRVVWNRPRNADHIGPVRQDTPVDEIPFLAVARSLGDLWSYNSTCNEFIVSPDPDVKVIKINPKTFRCLIFGTDGLWNVIDPQEAVDTVFEKEIFNERLQTRGDSSLSGLMWTNPSKCLVEKALKTWLAKKMRADNTSVVTVILYPSTNTGATIDYAKSELQSADFPIFNDVISYQDIAQKYFPPEEYQNYNYIDDSETEIMSLEKEINPFLIKCDNSRVTYWQSISWDKVSNPEEKIVWQNEAKTSSVTYKEDVSSAIDDSSFLDEDDDDFNEDDSEEEIIEEKTESTETESSSINYIEYPTERCVSINSSICRTTDVDGNFMNSFAESYNSLLTEQITEDSSTSNSSTTYQSISNSTMHDILQEQQLYQQECMSEEEGYSLTKLETRREQQRCNSVQTFKIFQQIEGNMSRSQSNLTAPSDLNESNNFWDLSFQGNTSFDVYQNHGQNDQRPEKPFELNSLLQQERAEEQQVAFERFEMQRKLVGDDASPNNLPIVNYEYTDSTMANQTLTESACIEEYLEEDVTLEEDETVQINEISSSVVDGTDIDMADSESQMLISSFSPVSIPIPAKLYPDHPSEVEKTEKTEILREKRERTRSQKTLLPTTDASFPSIDTSSKCLMSQKSTIAQFHYPNIPNENERVSLASSGYALEKCPRHGQFPASSKNLVARACTTNNPERRQLRSNSTILDYSKRTLRTRNSLSKDMKAKSTLVSSLKKSISVTAPFVFRSSVTDQQNKSSKRNREISDNNISDEVDPSRSKCGKLPIITASVNPNLTRFINLRSRQIAQGSTITVANTLQINDSSKNTINAIKMRLTSPSPSPSMRRERRSLRNLSQRSASRESTSSFSKSTRLQPSVSTFALQSPTPKLINAATAVAVATRARTLLSAATTADPMKNSAATITAIYGGGRRPNLRSNSHCHTVISSSSAPTVYHSTRSRAQKLKH